MNAVKNTLCKLPLIKDFLEIRNNIRILKNNRIDDYINNHMYGNPRYQNPKKLNKFEHQVYSQHGEDGIIAEIFKRIGTTNRFFVEFGTETGMCNNTTCLLLKNWTGAWIEANSNYIEGIKRKFSALISNKKLLLKNAFITAENVETMFKELDIPEDFDLLSIDIDGNDYWVWKAIKNYHPRAVAIEYNALFMPDVKWVIKYNPNHRWNYTCYFSASLKSLEMLGFKKGYVLVGCEFSGTNAFFVRKDLVGDNFLEPFTAENHYEPPRYHLLRQVGYPRDFGDFESI